MDTELKKKLDELEERMRRIEALLSDPTLKVLNQNLHIIVGEIRSLKG